MSEFTITADETQTGFFHHQNHNQDLRVIATGTFGSGTLSIQVQVADKSWVTIPGSEMTVPSSKTISLRAPRKVRFVMASSTAPNILLQLN